MEPLFSQAALNLQKNSLVTASPWNPKHPTQRAKKNSGSGLIAADGTFKISTFEQNDGAVPGKHKVAITPPVLNGDGPAPKPLIPSRYSDLGTSGLIINVEAGKPDIKLEVSKK